ncbi:MAG: transketolase family protein [Peptococcaceae bacterium]|jgi:transketolase|nr:transketolase family protein [Peptococcaceae bacterium]MBQ2368917.1 transketolase family protein [Peptococcaceae bacterium]MBQ2431997.1 transketolase family protein [Peptococcaceae bacterium]MBQ5615356.1 transketolase family protein [Peptococcaceae bacterium]MBQ5658852.1 transketolase family protein [Peptococcaceae bacterium]
MASIATRDAYGEALAELGAVNENIVVLEADLSKSTKTSDFKKVYPERFFNMGIAEQNMIGTAAGFAAAGKTPFASTFAVFAAGRAYDQIRNSIAYPNLNVKIAATHAGLTVGEDGGSHQMLEDIALMRALPNMTVIVPADGIETKQVIKAAAELEGPVYIRLGRPKVPVLFGDDYKFEIGKGVVLKEGTDVTLIGTGIMVSKAMEAAELLAAEGISAAVVNISTIKPLDAELIIAQAQKTGAVVTCEEHTICGGLGSAVAEVLVENCPVPMARVGVEDKFGESGLPDELLEKYGLSASNIAAKAKAVIAKK